VLLGSWLVIDDGGTLCARPSAENDWMVGVDCDVQRGNEPRITGFSSDGTPVCVVGGDGCWDGPSSPAAPDGVIRDVVPGESARAAERPTAHVSPNPFSGSAEIRLSGFEPNTVRASIYDVTGRLVRKIATRADAASSMRWDGRDERGHASRAGVYFLRIDSSEHRQTRKIVYLGP
jgi:hypothetical protein